MSLPIFCELLLGLGGRSFSVSSSSRHQVWRKKVHVAWEENSFPILSSFLKLPLCTIKNSLLLANFEDKKKISPPCCSFSAALSCSLWNVNGTQRNDRREKRPATTNNDASVEFKVEHDNHDYNAATFPNSKQNCSFLWYIIKAWILFKHTTKSISS